MKPSEFWELTWREFWLWVEGYEKRLKNEWMQSSEIMAGLRNLFALHTTKPGQRIKTIQGCEINPYSGYVKPDNGSNLQDFKELCKRLGIPWNPVKN